MLMGPSHRRQWADEGRAFGEMMAGRGTCRSAARTVKRLAGASAHPPPRTSRKPSMHAFPKGKSAGAIALERIARTLRQGDGRPTRPSRAGAAAADISPFSRAFSCFPDMVAPHLGNHERDVLQMPAAAPAASPWPARGRVNQADPSLDSPLCSGPQTRPESPCRAPKKTGRPGGAARDLRLDLASTRVEGGDQKFSDRS